MVRSKTDGKEKFLKRYNLTTFYDNAQKINPDIWNTCLSIRDDYKNYMETCQSDAESFVLNMLKDDELRKKVHSISYRVKSADSLIGKVLRKSGNLSIKKSENAEIEKYRDLDKDNYYKIITDIIGIRILIRYRAQWQEVHNWIWKRYFHGENKYIRNYLVDYNQNHDTYLVEKPIIYYREGDDARFTFELNGENKFTLKKSDAGYNSIHYVLNYYGKYIEIQVRTIFDEAWAECTHDVVYKCKNEKQKEELNNLSICLAKQTIAADAITNIMYDKINGKRKINKKSNEKSVEINMVEKSNYTNIIKLANNLSKKQKKSFNGTLKDIT